MPSSESHRILFAMLIALCCISAVSIVTAQDSWTYHYQGRQIDLNVAKNKVVVQFHNEAVTENVLATTRGLGLHVASTVVIPTLNMAILTLDPRPGADELDALRSHLHALPDVLCSAPLYSCGSSTCTTRDTVIARFSREIGKDERAVIASQATATIVKEFPGLEGWVLLRCLEPARHDPFEVANALLKNPRVLSAHPDFIHFVKKSAVPNDTYVNNQWALNKIDAPPGLGPAHRGREHRDCGPGRRGGHHARGSLHEDRPALRCDRRGYEPGAQRLGRSRDGVRGYCGCTYQQRQGRCRSLVEIQDHADPDRVQPERQSRSHDREG